MRTFKHFTFVILGALLALTSCTMEKRVYSPSYHVQWNKSKQKIAKEALVHSSSIEKVEQSQSATVEPAEDETVHVLQSNNYLGETFRTN